MDGSDDRQSVDYERHDHIAINRLGKLNAVTDEIVHQPTAAFPSRLAYSWASPYRAILRRRGRACTGSTCAHARSASVLVVRKHMAPTPAICPSSR